MTQPTALRLAELLESRNGNPTGFGLGPVLDRAAAELRRIHAENEALRADAERYRWLRGDMTLSEWRTAIEAIKKLCDVHLDAAIDAARGRT